MSGGLHALIRYANPADLDPFELWRWTLALICTIYALVVTLRSLAGWAAYLSGSEKATTLMRRYVLVQLLRLRARRFMRELLLIAGWSAALAAAVALHAWIRP